MSLRSKAKQIVGNAIQVGKQEPTMVLTTGLAVLEVVQGALSGHLDTYSITSVITLATGFGIRQNVNSAYQAFPAGLAPVGDPGATEVPAAQAVGGGMGAGQPATT